MTAHCDDDEDVAYYLPTEAKKMKLDESTTPPSEQYETDITVICPCAVDVSSSGDENRQQNDVSRDIRTSCDIPSTSSTLTLNDISSSDGGSISCIIHEDAGSSVAKEEVENELIVAKHDSGFEESLIDNDNNTLQPEATFDRTLQQCNDCENNNSEQCKEVNDATEASIETNSNVVSEANIKADDETICTPPEHEIVVLDIHEDTADNSHPEYFSEPSTENDALLPNTDSITYTVTKNDNEDDVLSKSTLRSFTASSESVSEHCRVCHSRGEEELISPCHCNGSLKYVHESCLITWMKNPFKESCEICRKKILIVKKRKPFYMWRWPLQRPTPLVWVMVFTIAICVNLMSVVKDATRKCVTTSCIIFYVIGSVGIILASMFLYFWVKRVKVFCETWKVQNEHWVVKIEDETV